MSKNIRVLLVDDHALMRDTLSLTLAGDPEIEVVGQASNGEEAVARAAELRPDVLLLDIEMPGLDCFEAAERIRRDNPSTKIIILSAFSQDRNIDSALRVGAMGYLTKSEPLTEVVEAIKRVAGERAYFSDRIVQRMIAEPGGIRLPSDADVRVSSLTKREIEVLRQIVDGRSRKQIAQVMHISVKTVDRHVENLMAKLDIHDRLELARYAIREGLVRA